MGRAPCCDKANVKKGPWSPEEDAKLKSYIDQHGTGGNWIALPQKIGLKRCGKSCRLRWLNYLRPNLKHGEFSEEEDNIICSLYITIGSRWSIIAAQLPGRTDNDIKNYWNTRLKKKLLGKQRKGKQSQKSAARGKVNTGANVIPGSLIINQNQPPVVTSYASQQQPPFLQLPAIPNSNNEPGFHDHTSIKKLLIKLGGRFSKEHDQYPVISETLIQPLYCNSMDIMQNSMQIPLMNTTHADLCSMLPGGTVDYLSNEVMEQLLYENPTMLEFFYNDIVVNSNTDIMTAASSQQNNPGFFQGSMSMATTSETARYPGTLGL